MPTAITQGADLTLKRRVEALFSGFEQNARCLLRLWPRMLRRFALGLEEFGHGRGMAGLLVLDGLVT